MVGFGAECAPKKVDVAGAILFKKRVQVVHHHIAIVISAQKPVSPVQVMVAVREQTFFFGATG